MSTPAIPGDTDGNSEYSEDLSSTPMRHIKDLIHDYIPVSAKLSQFIDTKQFQRLRNIKQLGTTQYVWPGASHTRFEHCLGVAHLARTMAAHLQKSQPELHITDRDVDCIEIAGLCHDLGHGPWSHVWDSLFIPKALKGLDKQWQHEDGSEMMFDYLVRANNIQIPVEDQNFIKALISGDSSRTPDEKGFLFDIVANKRNGLDVDKFDYIVRDSHMIDAPVHLSLVRLVRAARVLDNQICYDVKDANHIYDICNTRFKLHKSFYNHKCAKAIEYMIIDALLAAEPFLHIAERVFIPEKYLHLTDNIMPQIEASEEPELAESRAILDRIRTRDLYKLVDYKVIDWPMRQVFRQHITEQNIVDAALALAPTDDASNSRSLHVDDVIVDFSTMHFGMKEKNPLDFVKFYSKRHPNVSANAGPGEYSNLMPRYFAEDLLRVYTKRSEFYGLVQAGYRQVLANLADRNLLDGDDVITAGKNMAPTPPATEAPSTPKATSRDSSFSLPQGGSGSMPTPFSNNSFTTVPPSFAPGSPPQTSKKQRNAMKRGREESPVRRDTPVSKKRK